MLSVRDERHRVYRLTERLGRGGQGTVWRTEHPDLLVKLRDGEMDDVREEVRRVRRLPLQGLPVARPEAVVSVLRIEHDRRCESPEGAASSAGEVGTASAGFVMELEHSRQSLESLLEIDTNDVADWWRGLGGTEGRLRTLAAMAAVIAELHRRGLVAGDVSPRNFLLSRPSDPEPVVLIDPDDLHLAGDPPPGELRVSAPHVAPEVFRGDTRHDRRSDAYAVALLVAHAMLLEHPLMGKPVSTGSPDREIEALRGQLPWAYDRADESNPPNNRRDLAVVVGAEVTELLHRYFGEGRNDPASRPTAAALAHALYRAADSCRRCSACTDGGPGLECVGCGRALPPSLWLETVTDSRTRVEIWDGAQRILTRRIASGALVGANDPVLLIGTSRDGVRLESVGELPVIRVRGNQRDALVAGRPGEMQPGDELEVGDPPVRLRLHSQSREP